MRSGLSGCMTPRRVKAFAKEYARNGFNGTRAYLKVRPDVTVRSATVLSSRLLTRVDMDQVIGEVMGSPDVLKEVTPEFVLGKIKSLAAEARRDSDKLKALELLGKWLNLFKDKEIQNNLVLQLNDLEEIRSKIKPDNKSVSSPVHSSQVITPPEDSTVNVDTSVSLQKVSYRTNEEKIPGPEGVRPPSPPRTSDIIAPEIAQQNPARPVNASDVPPGDVSEETKNVSHETIPEAIISEIQEPLDKGTNNA